MSVSAIFGARVTTIASAPTLRPKSTTLTGGGGAVVIECSSRPKKKATSHHMKTRPKKTQPWDVRRKPTVYPPLPPLPPDWTLVSSSTQEDAAGDGAAAVETPVSTGS